MLQEVGFDIVSIWGHMGWLAKLVLVLIALILLGLIVALISKLVHIRHLDLKTPLVLTPRSLREFPDAHAVVGSRFHSFRYHILLSWNPRG